VTVLWEQRRTRTFGWGAVYICDAERYEPDDHDFHKGGPVWATPDDVAVATVHAGAVDPAEADVELLIQVLDQPLPSAGYTMVINVPSGILNIGDADESDDIALRPGQWRLQINVDRPEEPSVVEIYLSAAP
jgi:hypothetical protein